MFCRPATERIIFGVILGIFSAFRVKGMFNIDNVGKTSMGMLLSIYISILFVPPLEGHYAASFCNVFWFFQNGVVSPTSTPTLRTRGPQFV